MICINKFFLVFLLLLSTHSTPFSASVKKDKFIVNPTVTNFDSFPTLTTNAKWLVSSVEYNGSLPDSGIIGYTRVGVKTTAPIICTPPLQNVLKKSLESLLQKKGVLSQDISTANFLIRMSILEFSLNEKSSILTQTMNSKIKIRVNLIDPLDAERVREFVVESESVQTALDTSKYAEDLVRSVIEDVLAVVWKTINK